LAFTLCTRRQDGTFDIHGETTVKSTIMTEAPLKSSTSTAKITDIPATSFTPNQKFRCPHCSNCFNANQATISTGGGKRKANDTTGRSVSKTSTLTSNRNSKKKKKKYEYE